MGADFSSRNEDRVATEKVPMLDPAWLMKLPKGQAFALLEGGRLVKLRMPLPLPADDDIAPASWAQMLGQMRATYDEYIVRTPDGPLTVEGESYAG
jgi:conjugal transfer pilus assembly protein TraD